MQLMKISKMIHKTTSVMRLS